MKPSHPLLSNNPLLGLQNQVNATKEHTNTPGLNLPGLSTQALTQAQAQLAQVQVILLLRKSPKRTLIMTHEISLII